MRGCAATETATTPPTAAPPLGPWPATAARRRGRYFLLAFLHIPFGDQIARRFELGGAYQRDAGEADPRPPDGPEQHDFDAAIGFVDVSGFTALSEAMTSFDALLDDLDGDEVYLDVPGYERYPDA